jgi:hypothetical protein
MLVNMEVMKILPRKAQVVDEGAEAAWVLIGCIVSEGVVVPDPDNLFAGVLDNVWGAEPVCAHGMNGCAVRSSKSRDQCIAEIGGELTA